jgi:2-oxoisovalerate dehydrogenase E1 component
MSNVQNFSKKELLRIYRFMVLSRRLDEKQLILLRQGKVYFHIGASGHEAAQVGAALNFIPKKDWGYCYYRDQAFVLSLGMSEKEILLQMFAKADDPNSGGRQMPHHWGHRDLKIVTKSSCTGMQYLHATGTALGAVKEKTDEVVYVSGGEGATSEGEFFEALNWSSREKLPVIFHVQDNKYAISVHVSEQTPGGSIFQVTAGYPNLHREQINGTDFFEVFTTFQKAVRRARSGDGPTLIVSDVVRLLPHSSSDDHRKYRSQAELEEDQVRDPILNFVHACLESGKVKPEEFDEIQQEVKQTIERTVIWAEKQADPDPKRVTDFVFDQLRSPHPPKIPSSTGDRVVIVDAINHALHEEMEADDNILVFGQDVADPKGGVFSATRGLTQKFGKKRVYNSPLAEASIVGTAVGLAIRGFKPVVEIQFMDYIWPAFMQIKNELATIRYRSNNAWSAPVIIRTPVGGYIHGALYHSQSAEAHFAHIPGIKVVFPSNSADAKGLLKASIRGNDPVLFCEHKGLYRQAYAARPEPDRNYVVPLGFANIVQPGEDLTIVTWGMQVQKSIEAVKMTGEDKFSIEIIDIRTLIPLDIETILNSVKKTGKVMIIHEDTLTGGFAGEIAARIADEAFEYLDGPVKRICAKDTPIPYHPKLEQEVLPTVNQILNEIKQLLEY